MQSVSIITNCGKKVLLGITLLVSHFVSAQENSPYSRYGIGDLLPNQNIVNRAMGGVSAAYHDPVTVNFTNPASYARLKYVTFDVGIDYTSRTIRSSEPVKSLQSGYITPSYIQIGVPLSKKNNWGMNFGLKPMSRINYSLQQRESMASGDSLQSNYIGSGGTYQAFFGTGIGTKNFTVGANVGYMFGNKNYTTEKIFLNDSIGYERGKWADSTHFGGLFIDVGVQYTTKIGKNYQLKMGGFGQLKSTMNATRELSRETYINNALRGQMTKDSVFLGSESGKINLPATYGAGVSFEKLYSWALHAEYNASQWNDYRFYGQRDQVQNSWVMRIGGSVIPNFRSNSYWSQVQYKAGFYTGKDYVSVDRDLNIYAFTFGASFPVAKYGYALYSGQHTSINLAFEVGARGNKNNAVRDNFYRVSLGMSLSDIWFIKRTYQ